MLAAVGNGMEWEIISVINQKVRVTLIKPMTGVEDKLTDSKRLPGPSAGL